MSRTQGEAGRGGLFGTGSTAADDDVSPASSGDAGVPLKTVAAQTLARDPSDGSQRSASPTAVGVISQSSGSMQHGGNVLSVTR